MNGMFYLSEKFNYKLQSWSLNPNIKINHMFEKKEDFIYFFTPATIIMILFKNNYFNDFTHKMLLKTNDHKKLLFYIKKHFFYVD